MLVVQKYGGSSLGTLERIRSCAAACYDRARAGQNLVVVVSAMAGETNRLIALANELQGAPAPAVALGPYVAPSRRSGPHDRELDQLVATGEIVSAALLTLAIQNLGGQAISLVGAQLGLHTDRRFGGARILQVDRQRLDRELGRGAVVVCAGFQGVDAQGDITTLGRGGSDTSAVALAAALHADVCEILTDVDGIYTADPRLVPNARRIPRLGYEEMLELAGVGAKVLHIRSVELAMRYGVVVHVRSSFDPGPGTLVGPEETHMESIFVSGVALDPNEAKLTLRQVPDVPGTVAQIFGALAQLQILVDMIIQNAGAAGRADVTFTVPKADMARAQAALAELEFGEPRPEVLCDPQIAKISIVGVGMRSHAGVAAQAFGFLAQAGVNVQMVSTSEIKISVVVQEADGPRALAALHDGFGLGTPPG